MKLKTLFFATISVVAALLLSACGTPYATVPNRAGEPVMLLGHDPVAYFTQGSPARGKPEHKVSLPERTYYFADVLGKTAWQLDPKWNVDHGDRLWPAIADKGWRGVSLASYASKVPHYKTGAQIRAEWNAKNPGKPWPAYDVGGMVSNLFTKPPGWRAAEGFSQPALGYPD